MPLGRGPQTLATWLRSGRSVPIPRNGQLGQWSFPRDPRGAVKTLGCNSHFGAGPGFLAVGPCWSGGGRGPGPCSPCPVSPSSSPLPCSQAPWYKCSPSAVCPQDPHSSYNHPATPAHAPPQGVRDNRWSKPNSGWKGTRIIFQEASGPRGLGRRRRTGDSDVGSS